jgi:hypothetical protein
MSMGKKSLEINAEPFGPNQKTLGRAADKMLKGPLARRLKGCQYTLLSVTATDAGPARENREDPLPLDRVRTVFYDYTNEVSLICEGALDDAASCTIQERRYHPIPSPKEFEAAVAKLRKSPEYGSALKAGTLIPYRPMPPLVVPEDGDGDEPRTITVGLRPSARYKARARQSGFGHEIVGVRMQSGDLQQFSQGAPCRSRAEVRGCGAPTGADQQTVKSAAGQAWITIKKDNVVLWRFLAIRPAASSGTNGSGIELRYVSYRGKRVLYRAHVPILNVKYDNNACGPFRDWQNEEGMIQASGTELAPGILRCNTPAKTIFDTGSDTGTYLGVGVYEENEETVLVSEMEAGWYRYMSQWRFTMDGTIKPRFGFAAVENSCVCNRHHHHAYWRFDFDIMRAGSNQVFEHNSPPLSGSPNPWRPLNFEVRRARNPARQRQWRIQNTVTKEAYLIVPGPNDGIARLSPDWPFGRGDVWIMRGKRNAEIDDGVVATGPPYEADLDRFITGESIKNQDIIVWYAGHFTHDLTHDEPATHGHIVGPDLVPENW